MDKLGNILPKIVRRQPGGARLMGMQVATAFRHLMGPDVAGLCDEVESLDAVGTFVDHGDAGPGPQGAGAPGAYRPVDATMSLGS